MTTYYIRKLGNDSNNGLSGSGAWETFLNANNNMVAGDIVYIGEGDYTGGTNLQSWVYPQNSGNSGSYITYYGDKKGIYTGDAGDVIVEEIFPSSYIYVKGIKATLSLHGQVTALSCIIDACYFPWSNLTNMGGSTVKNCIIEFGAGSGDTCIYASSPAGNLYIYNNTLIAELDKNIITCGGQQGFYIYNNIFYRKSGSGYFIYFDTFESKTFCDYNCFYSSSFSGDFGRWKEWDIPGPIHIEATFEDWQSSSSWDANSFVADPLFVGALDYHIQETSPCIDSGSNVGVTDDYDYHTRPKGAGYDIGAYEFGPETIQQTILSDAHIYFETFQQTILSDAHVIGAIQQFILSDADIIGRNQQLLTSDAYIFPATSSDPFVFESVPISTSFSLKTKDESKLTLLDVKLKHTCDHNLPSGKYTLNDCPRCLGKGYYFDIKFSPRGDVFTVSEIEKLLQELVKITLTSKGGNFFHDEYGSYVSDSIGMVQSKNFREARLKQSIIDAVLRLRYLQRDGIEKGYKFSLKELIDKISKIEIYEIENDPTQLGFKVTVQTVEGRTAILQGSVTL